MIKSTKKYFTVAIVSFVICIITGIVVRESFHGSTDLEHLQRTENLDEYQVQFMEADDQSEIFASVSNYKELDNKTKLIAKVEVTDNRVLCFGAIKTQAVLKEIYKSDQQLYENEKIYIYEPVEVVADISKTYTSLDGYQLMETGKEYYVFLNPIKTIKGYHKSKEDKVTYMPSTTKFSVLETGHEQQKILDENKLDGEGDRYLYGQVKELRILTSNQKNLDTYNSIKKDFINNLKK